MGFQKLLEWSNALLEVILKVELVDLMAARMRDEGEWNTKMQATVRMRLINRFRQQLEEEVKGLIITLCKAGGPFLPLVEPEAASLPLVGVGFLTSQPPPYTMEEPLWIILYTIYGSEVAANAVEKLSSQEVLLKE
ncbi:hypothetical protein Tco_1562988 [Tanacetum coccineum]